MGLLMARKKEVYKLSYWKEVVFLYSKTKGRYYIATGIDPEEFEKVLEGAGMVVESCEMGNIDIRDGNRLYERLTDASL